MKDKRANRGNDFWLPLETYGYWEIQLDFGIAGPIVILIINVGVRGN
jgi:hypothetical protein